MAVAEKTAWVWRAPDGVAHVDMHFLADTSSASSPSESLFLTNDADALRQLLDTGDESHGASVLDLADPFRLAFPDSSAEAPEQMMAVANPSAAPAPPSAATLGQVAEAVSARLATFPLWALETMELLLREIGEETLARYVARRGERVRKQGRRCGAWQESFAPMALRQARRIIPSHADCSPLDEEALAALLMPGGALAGLMPGYEPRPGQVEMLRAVVQAFNGARHLLVEAGTGVGKSVAYLLPAAVWARLNDVPVVVSTNTRNLQSQLLDKDIPLVQKVVDALPDLADSEPLRVALLKGRSNYLCLRRLGALLEYGQYELERSDLRMFVRTVAWSVQSSAGDLDELAGGCGFDASFLSRLASVGEECLGRSCRHYRRCFLQQARERALQAHVVIANHALVFAEMATPGLGLPVAGQIIFDEAHNLEEAATRLFSVEVTPARLATLMRRLSRGSGRHSGGVMEMLRRQIEKGDLGANPDVRKSLLRQTREAAVALEGMQDASHGLFRALHALLLGDTQEPRRIRRAAPDKPPMLVPLSNGEPETGDAEIAASATHDQERTKWHAVERAVAELRDAAMRVDQMLRALAQAIRTVTAGELSLHEEEALDLEACGMMLRTFALDADFASSAADSEHVFWVQRCRGREKTAEIWAAPLRIGPKLATELYEQKSSVIFCSATLRVGASFDFLAGRLGIGQIPPERLSMCVAASPFDYQRQCAVLAPAFLPEPGVDGRAYAEQLSGMMLDVFAQTRGRALGLFTSYEMMQRCAKLLREPLAEEGIRLLVQGETGSRDQITRIFRGGQSCVLLGTHSFWEGVDVVGDALSCVVMARLPFAAVGEPIQEARREQIEAEGGQGFMAFSLPNAVIRFRQGFGRLIRHRTDRGVVIVADPRLVTRHYAARFKRSLPCAVEVIADRESLLSRIAAVLG